MVAILTYHSLDDDGSVLSVSPRAFAEQMRCLSDQGARVIALGEVPSALREARPGARLVAITFDDGFRSVCEHALPILRRYGFTATVFLVTDYCGKTNSWPGQPRHVTRRALMGWAEVREMSDAGITFGSHTRTHPDLRTLPASAVEAEMVDSQRAIEDAIGRPVDALAYPYGAHDSRVRRLAAASFSLACSTTLGFPGPASDLLGLERLDVYYVRRPLVFRRLFSPDLGAYLRLRRAARALRRRLRERAGEPRRCYPETT